MNESDEAPDQGATVTLREITKDTMREILRLEVAPEQNTFVANNAVSIAQAHFEPKAWFRAIYADETPVGFIMLFDDAEKPEYFLWRLMLDARQQGKGYGRQAIALLVEYVRTRPNARELLVSYHPGDGSPRDFYLKLGFQETSQVEEGEVVLRLPLVKEVSTLMFNSHPYAGDTDRERLRAFLTAATAEDARSGRRTYWHVGDLLWALYQNTELDPASTIRLWEDERGEVAGFGWFDEPEFVEWQIAPQWRAAGELASEMLAWGEQRAREAGASVLRSRAANGDTEALALLAAHGFERDDRTPLALQQRRGFPSDGYYELHLARDLRQPIPEADAEGGASGGRPYETHAVGGEDEWPARVELHRAVWHPSRVTVEAYRRLRGVPGYRPELDLVAVAPNGDFAAYCICWLDAENRTGEFEPVGTALAYRRQGAGRAVMLEGLRRLRAAGAETAIVYTNANNRPAVALYESVGFRVYDEEHYCEKPLGMAG